VTATNAPLLAKALGQRGREIGRVEMTGRQRRMVAMGNTWQPIIARPSRGSGWQRVWRAAMRTLGDDHEI
jgi:hypothetical protein